MKTMTSSQSHVNFSFGKDHKVFKVSFYFMQIKKLSFLEAK